jgi:hypothetical protein
MMTNLEPICIACGEPKEEGYRLCRECESTVRAYRMEDMEDRKAYNE